MVIKISQPVLAQLTFYATPKSYGSQYFSMGQTHLKTAASLVGMWTPIYDMVPYAHPSLHQTVSWSV